MTLLEEVQRAKDYPEMRLRIYTWMWSRLSAEDCSDVNAAEAWITKQVIASCRAELTEVPA